MAEPNLPLSYNLGEVTCPVCENPEALDQIFTINYTDDRSNEHYSICTVCKHVFTFETVPFEDEEGRKVHKLVDKKLLLFAEGATKFLCPKCARRNSKRKASFEVARRECLECSNIWTPIEILKAAQDVRERQLTPEQLQTLRDKQARRLKRENTKRIERIAELNPNIEEKFEELFEQNPGLFETLADKEG